MKKLMVFILMLLFLIRIDVYGAELPDVKAQGACLMDYETGRVLYEKNEDEPLPMASTTKIMTCIIALESGKLDDIVTASQNAANAPKVRLGLKKGEKHRLYDLLYPLMMISGNDCAVAIAEHIGGSVEGFAKMMNEKAKEIGAKDTEFVTPNGLDSGNHHSTAYDMALITRYALHNDEFRKIISTREITIPLKNSDEKSYSLMSKNRLLSEFDGAIGVKTGFTGKAGNCFVGAAERDGLTLITVNLASGWGNIGKEQKWRDAKNMLNYGFYNYKKYKIAEKGKVLGKTNVTFSNIRGITDVCKDDGFAVLTDDEYKNLKTETDIKDSVEATVKSGDVMGKIIVSTDMGEVLFESDIVASNSAERYKFKECLKNTIKLWFKNSITNYLTLFKPYF